MLAIGRALHGVDVNAPDGQAAKLFFMLLIPEGQADQALGTFVVIVQAVATEAQRTALLEAKDRADILDALGKTETAEAPGLRYVE